MTGTEIWERVLLGLEAWNKFNHDVESLRRAETHNRRARSAAPPANNTIKARVTKRDVFEDLELSDGETFEKKIKIEVWSKLVDHIARGNYTRAELAQILHIYQPDVSNLLHAKFSKFSTDTLIRYADELNLHVDFRISTSEISPAELEHTPTVNHRFSVGEVVLSEVCEGARVS